MSIPSPRGRGFPPNRTVYRLFVLVAFSGSVFLCAPAAARTATCALYGYLLIDNSLWCRSVITYLSDKCAVNLPTCVTKSPVRTTWPWRNNRIFTSSSDTSVSQPILQLLLLIKKHLNYDAILLNHFFTFYNSFETQFSENTHYQLFLRNMNYENTKKIGNLYNFYTIVSFLIY